MKNVLFVAVLTVLVTGLALAQGGASAVALCAFTVSTELAIDVSDGDWGDLAPGTNYTITADGTITPADAGGSAEVGGPITWTITGQPGANVVVTFALPAFFEGDGIGGGGMRIPYSAGSQSAGWSSASFAVGDPYTPMDPRIANTITLIAGEADVQLGGFVNVPIGAPATDYEANFVLTAAYAGL